MFAKVGDAWYNVANIARAKPIGNGLFRVWWVRPPESLDFPFVGFTDFSKEEGELIELAIRQYTLSFESRVATLHK